MTASGDFLPLDENQGREDLTPTYNVVFGVELTPKIQGIALAVLGLIGAYALYNFLVQPVQEQKTALEGAVAQKEAQVAQQRASLQDRAALQAELNTSLEQRVGVYSLLGGSQTLDTLLLDINQQIQNSNAAISDVLRADTAQLDNAQLAALGLTREQISRAKTVFAGSPQVQNQLFTSELLRFNPSPSSLVVDGVAPELVGKLERVTVDVSMQALFPQTLSIIRNIERLEPLIIIRDMQQSIAPPPDGASEEQLLGISRLLLTDYTLEVLVPVGDPTVPPAPPPEPAAEGEGEAEGEAPPEGG